MIPVFLVENHGIPEQTIEAVIFTSKLFFSLPEEAKLKVGEGACCIYIFIVCVVWRYPDPNFDYVA